MLHATQTYNNHSSNQILLLGQGLGKSGLEGGLIGKKSLEGSPDGGEGAKGQKRFFSLGKLSSTAFAAVLHAQPKLLVLHQHRYL